MVTVACVLYQGEDVPSYSLGIFTPEWVDRLYRGIKRNTTRDFRFVCFVDRDYEFSEPVEAKKLELPYRNMFSLLEPFREDMGRVVFMGLDTVITGNIDPLMDYDGPFAMLTDPYFPERPCSGVMSFPYMPELWQDILDTHEEEVNKSTMFGYASDMIYLAKHKSERIDHYVDGIYSYKAHIKLNPSLIENSSIIYFHGREKPHELAGLDWVDECWGEPLLDTPQFVSSLNTSSDVMMEQAIGNLSRELPMLEAQVAHEGKALIVGGGPSLAETFPDIAFKKAMGAKIFSTNATHDWLISKGIVPDYHVMLDARPENAEFVSTPHQEVNYLIAAQCHPSVFEAVRGNKVTSWCACFEDHVQDLHVSKQFPGKKIMMVGGGATVGLKTINLAYLLGFRDLEFYGFDSCYRGEANHAYKQPLNDNEEVMQVFVKGREFKCAPWMAKQAMEFQRQAKTMKSLDCSITVNGDGLISWMLRPE